MIDQEEYNKRQESIIHTIHNIVNDTTISRAVQSHKIMKLLRNECLFVCKEYLAAKNRQNYATLDPNDVGVKNILSRYDIASDWFSIFANSFGPFNPKEYFKPENIKILWLLKESYITKESWIKGDRGGHNQAKENRLWSDIVHEDNSTLKNLIHITQTILTKLDDNEIQPLEQETMNHICILEVDHFPWLNFNSPNSKDSYMNSWGKFNQSLIKVLIEFYEPSIIVFGHTLEYFKEWGDFYNYNKVFSRYKQANLIILNDTISEWTYIHNKEEREVIIDTAQISSLSENEIINVGKNIKYLGKSGRIYIQADHPTKVYKQILLDIDATRIKKWYNPEKHIN